MAATESTRGFSGIFWRRGVFDREAGGEVGAGDRRGARAAVGLEDVAVEPERVLAELVEVDDGAEGAADEALDLNGAAVDFAAGDVAGFPLERGVRQHRILGCEPAAGDFLLFHPRGHAGLDGGGADDAREAEGDEHGAGRVWGDVGLEGDCAELVGLAAVETLSGGHSREV